MVDRDVASVEVVSSNLTACSTPGVSVRKHWGALVCMCLASWSGAATGLVHRVCRVLVQPKWMIECPCGAIGSAASL